MGLSYSATVAVSAHPTTREPSSCATTAKSVREEGRPLRGGQPAGLKFVSNFVGGCRHIKYKHGYGPDDERDTVLALSDSAPSKSPPGSTSWKIRYSYTNVDAQGSISCLRTVIVQY